MKVKISHELKLKLLEYEKIEAFSQSPYLSNFNIQFKIKITDQKILKECEKWIREINRFFKSSYEAAKINLGPYEGLWPIYLEGDKVTFRADVYHKNKSSWKDWFVIEEIEDPPQFIQEEI